MTSILNKIPTEVVENLKLYRLGIIENCSYELIELKKEEKYQQHYHNNSEVKFLCILGEGILLLGNRKENYKEGDSFYVRKGVKHGFLPAKDSIILSIQSPPIKDPKSKKEDIHF